jgi:hypothetical protein
MQVNNKYGLTNVKARYPNNGNGNDGDWNIGAYNQGNGNVGNNNRGNGNVGDANVGNFNHGTSLTGNGMTDIPKLTQMLPPGLVADERGRILFTTYPMLDRNGWPTNIAYSTNTLSNSNRWEIPSKTSPSSGISTRTGEPVPPPTTGETGNDNSRLLIILAIVGSILLLLFLLILLLYFCCRKRSRRPDNIEKDSIPMAVIAPPTYKDNISATPTSIPQENIIKNSLFSIRNI